MSRVVHFEIPIDNPERAIGFYQGIFGWEIDKWDGPEDYWLVKTGEGGEVGINGGFMRRQQPGQGVCNTIGVGSVDEYAQKVEGAGGQVVVPRMAIPGVGYLIYCQDTEGNVFGLFETDETAQTS